MGLLQSHPGIVMGGELFNPRAAERGHVAWPDVSPEEMPALNEERAADPVGFVQRRFADAAAKGAAATGCKIMYYHTKIAEGAWSSLLATSGLKVVHLRRENLLGRFVSWLQARETDRWDVREGATAPKAPKVTVDPAEMVRDFLATREEQSKLEHQIAGHQVFDITYERLSAEPAGEAARVCEFLGVPAFDGFAVKYKKTGAKDLRDAVENYEEIAELLRGWAGFVG
jgi:hypothetical protein